MNWEEFIVEDQENDVDDDDDDFYDDESNIKNDDALNGDDLNKLDDLIDNDLDEDNVLFTNRSVGNKRKLNEIEIETNAWREHFKNSHNTNNKIKTNQKNEENDLRSTAKIQKTFIEKRNQSPSNVYSPLNSPSSPTSHHLSILSSAFTTKCTTYTPKNNNNNNNNNTNTKSTTASNPSDHFTLIVKNTANSIDNNNNSLTCECLHIEAVSKNCIFFLKQTQVNFFRLKTNLFFSFYSYHLSIDFFFVLVTWKHEF